MGKPVDHVKNEIERLIVEYQLDDFDKEELGAFITAKYNIKSWEVAIINLRKQLDIAVSHLTVDQYIDFLEEVKNRDNFEKITLDGKVYDFPLRKSNDK